MAIDRLDIQLWFIKQQIQFYQEQINIYKKKITDLRTEEANLIAEWHNQTTLEVEHGNL